MNSRVALRMVDVVLGVLAAAGILVVAAAVGVMIWTALPISHVPRQPLAVTNLANARTLAKCCSQYAAEHEGHYPPTLKSLVPEYLPSHLEEDLYFREGRDNDRYLTLKDWLYFGAGFESRNPPKLFIASPAGAATAKEPSRIAIDALGETIKDAKYDRALEDTLRRIETLEESRRPPRARKAQPPAN